MPRQVEGDCTEARTHRSELCCPLLSAAAESVNKKNWNLPFRVALKNSQASLRTGDPGYLGVGRRFEMDFSCQVQRWRVFRIEDASRIPALAAQDCSQSEPERPEAEPAPDGSSFASLVAIRPWSLYRSRHRIDP